MLAGIACAFAGLCYAELASWIIGWDLILEYSLSSSTVAVGWSAYAVTLLGEMGINIPARLAGAPGTRMLLADGTSVTAFFNLPAVIICLAVTALLVRGIRESSRVNTIIVILKVAVLAIFTAVGMRYANGANLHPFIPPNAGQFGSFGWSGILRGAGIIFFAYIGFDAVSTASQETKNPGRNVPIGILVSLAVCTVVYIAVGLVTTAITGVVVAIASGLFPVTVLGLLVSMGTLLAFAIVCTGVLILRKTAPDTARPFRTPGIPWVPIIGTLICLYLMTGLPLPTWIRLFVWLAVGLTIYFTYGRVRAAAVRDQAMADAA